jgi:5-methylcytosine-specific restriction endonuclease McrA
MLEADYGVNHCVSDKRYVYETMLKRDNDLFKETLKNSTKEELMLDIEYLRNFQRNEEITKLCYDQFMYPSCVKFIDKKMKEIECYLNEIEITKVKTKTKEKVKKNIPSTIKKLVWNIHIGEDIGKSKCTCCKSTDITQMSFHCGHIVAESKGGKPIVSNLAPICQNCNSSMGTKNMKEFMETLK